MDKQRYIGLMSGTSMDGVDAVLVSMKGSQWHRAEAHSFLPYSGRLKQELLNLQNTGINELHRSMILAQELSLLYAEAVDLLLQQTHLQPANITALGCHGQTIRHAPENGYSIQLVNLPLLAEKTGIFTIGDFRSRDIASGGQGAPLVPAFHQAVFQHPDETRVLLNIGGIANISILPPSQPAFGFDTGPGNMLMDAWVQYHFQQPYDKNGTVAQKGNLIPSLLNKLLSHPYFALPHPKSTGRELFSLNWLQTHLSGSENIYDVQRTLLEYTAITITDAIQHTAPSAGNVYVCGGGVYNPPLINRLSNLLPEHTALQSTDSLHLNPQWVEAAAFAWLAACWITRTPSAPHHATGADKPCILGAGHYA